MLHACTSWLHWSYMDGHWDSSHGEENESIPRKGCRLAAAYVAGMVGHALCAASKVIECVFFIFITMATAIHYLTLYLLTQDKSSDPCLLNKARLVLLESSFTLGMSLPACLIDCIGTVAPPLSYYLHDLLKNSVTLPFLLRHRLIDKKENFSFSAYMGALS